MRKYTNSVFQNRRFIFIVVCSGLVLSSPHVAAQVPTNINSTMQSVTSKDQADTRANLPANVMPSTNSQAPILRLEDTIRGNKEQPQVLTIVPWQLPVHQRINENSEWQLQVSQLPSIERNAFLRNLAVVKELNATQVSSKTAPNNK